MSWVTESEQFEASVSAETRQGLYDKFTYIACDYFGVAPANLLIKCFGAGVDEEQVNSAGSVISRTYTANFGAVMGHTADDVT
jgi:hypothetical protein